MNAKEKIQKLYTEFFLEMGIDQKTGVFKNPDNKEKEIRKFATYPYIGERYENKKLLFVGLDIGSDETRGKISKFEFRSKAIAKRIMDPQENEHIPGTFTTTVYLLREEFPDDWKRMVHPLYRSHRAAISSLDELFKKEIISYFALTNFYKYVTRNRGNQKKERSGKINDRKFLEKQKELDLFLKEIEAFSPNHLIFQSRNKAFLKILEKNNIVTKLKNLFPQLKIYAFYHPSNREIHAPEKYVEARILL